MAKSTKELLQEGSGPPDLRDSDALERWLLKQPREWSVTIAARAALRSLHVKDNEDLASIGLHVFRTAAVARFAAKYPRSAIGAAAAAAATAAAVNVPAPPSAAVPAALAAAADVAAYSAAHATACAVNTYVHVDATTAASLAAAAYAAVNHDAQQLYDGVLTTEQLAREQLWPFPAPAEVSEAWQQLRRKLMTLGSHWQVWIDWYESFAIGEPHGDAAETVDAAYTDISGLLPWEDGAQTVNTEIARRLAELRRSKIPDQSPAPVRVEERDGKVAKASDRDSALNASERDFKAWRDPVVDHVDELTASDFAKGTNHSRVRDRLLALGKLLPGEIEEVKERQFRIGYEIERFEGLMAAYRTGGEDMPVLNAAQLEDIDRLRVALKMGVDKLERWSEFHKQANESTTGEANADRETVADAMEVMAELMERRPQYFHPELPASFRFLAEAVRDRSGATKTVVFGAVKSVENVVSFLGQRALGIGKKSVEAVETHISKAVATSLITGLSSAAIGLSGALPQGWAWLKPLLAALGIAAG